MNVETLSSYLEICEKWGIGLSWYGLRNYGKLMKKYNSYIVQCTKEGKLASWEDFSKQYKTSKGVM